MAKFQVISRVDAFVDYVAEIEADDPHSAASIAYSGDADVIWRRQRVTEFDARRIATLDEHGEEIESTALGKF
ncbi:MAG: hypothetical protein HLUCCA04_05770 [Oceanicaulis sp. HLUCCA04]|nr:MAG: hypothetical protein HLUCCA04_05770 [Oceanicaulis sp. HLUCCA04]